MYLIKVSLILILILYYNILYNIVSAPVRWSKGRLLGTGGFGQVSVLKYLV